MAAEHPVPVAVVPHQAPFEPDMSAMKLTRGTSCVLCQQRKVRCDKNKPCANCVKARVECRIVPPQPPRRRKKRLQEKDLIERLRKYESMLADNGVKFDAIAADLRPSGDRESVDDVADLEEGFEGLKTSPGSSQSPSAESRRSIVEKPFRYFPFHRQFRASEELLRDSSEEEAEGVGSTIHQAFDKMYENQDGFPFIVGGRNAPVTHLHPTAVQIFQLWQVYINNVNPLLRMTHVPTLQAQIIEASARLERTPKGVEAMMFAIYLMAVTSLEEDSVLKMFDESRSTMLARYHHGLQQALVNAGFMRSNDIMVLQAFTLYLIGIRQFIDPRQIFCLIGIAVRVAHRMGLHRDPEAFGLSPFEVEQRRNLWWTLVAYDRRIGEMTGSTVTALSSGGDCKLPLNINDTDLHVNGKDSPTPHTGATEMLFSLTRLTLAMAVWNDNPREKPVDASTPSTPSSSHRPVAAIRLASQEGPTFTMDGFTTFMENTYLKYCDPKIPLHFFTLTMTRQMLCKMRVISFLVKLGGSDSQGLNEMEREMLFLEATQMIEYDNVVQSAESLQGYKWYTYLHFPFPAYMFLVAELRRRTTGAMVERAWDAITENHRRRLLMNNLHSPMHIAFGNLFIKAWDARLAAEQAHGRTPETPSWINWLRQRADKMKRAEKAGRPSPGDPAGFPKTPGDEANGAASDSPGGGPDGLLMTPAEKVAGGGVAVQTSPAGDTLGGGSSEGDPENMDWSYLMQEYNGSMGGYGGGGFGVPGGGMSTGMGGMGGLGAMMGGGFGNGLGGGVQPGQLNNLYGN